MGRGTFPHPPLYPAAHEHRAEPRPFDRRPAGQRQRSREADGSRTLYVLKDGAQIAVSVKTGANDGENTEILSGLKEGDLVIVGTGEARGS